MGAQLSQLLLRDAREHAIRSIKCPAEIFLRDLLFIETSETLNPIAGQRLKTRLGVQSPG
jgi:hypothetical protein